MNFIDLSPNEVMFILISSILIVTFIAIKLSKKEGIEEEEKRKQFKKLSEECFLDIKNLSKYHKMMIYVDLFFSVLQNSNKESSLKEMEKESSLKETEINQVSQTSEKLKKIIEDPNFQKVKSKIDDLPLEYKKQIVAALTKNNLFFEKDDDLQTFLVFLYLIMCIESLIIGRSLEYLQYLQYEEDSQEFLRRGFYFDPAVELIPGYVSPRNPYFVSSLSEENE